MMPWPGSSYLIGPDPWACMSESQSVTDKDKDGTLPCSRCGGEMHPMFLYEDRDPDVWLCFSCGYLEWTNPKIGRPIPSVDQ